MKKHDDTEKEMLQNVMLNHSYAVFKEAVKCTKGRNYIECRCHQVKEPFRHNLVKIGGWDDDKAANFNSVADYILYQDLMEVPN
uniref:DBD_Tnp_Mut domain-containing protein n=1 Tax=Rhabditophanes sp. KR3021 TaxID=114890 RepID=A0AC35TYM4_9BILA